MNPRLFSFVGGPRGAWSIVAQSAPSGDPLPAVERLEVHAGLAPLARDAAWRLCGVTSHDRYVERAEKARLVAVQQGLGRPEATCAALIPIRKTATWWALAQDERRTIVEAQSQHIAIGLRYLPAIARRLHHSRDLAEAEAFDFLTWFEFAPDEVPAFDRLLVELRATPEWRYVEREVELRLVRAG